MLAPLLIAVLAIAAFQLRVQHKMVDFSVYWQAATRFSHAQPLYQVADGHYQFKYLPAFAMLTVPLTMFDEEAAKMMWFALSVGALVLFLRLSARFVPERRRRIAVLIALTAVFMAKFDAHELVLGQVNLFFGLLVIAAIGALQVDAGAVAGALLGAAVCIKPYGVLFAPWLAVVDRSVNRRAIVTFAGVFFVALIAPAAVYGLKGNFQLLADWWRTVMDTTAPNLTGTDNVSFAAAWAKWIGAGSAARLAAGVTSAAGLGVVIDAWLRRSTEDTGTDAVYLEGSMLLVLVPLLSPQGWDYVLLLATPAVALLFDRMPELPRPWRIAAWSVLGVMGFAIFDVVGRAAYTRLMAWSIITLSAVGVLICLSKLRRLQLA